MNDSDGRTEAEFQSALADGERILRIADASADHRIDIDVKLGVLGQQLQLAVENLQAFLRDFVGVHVVDRNLQPLQAGAVEALNAVGGQQVTVGDKAGDDAALVHAVDDVVEVGCRSGSPPLMVMTEVPSSSS